MAQFVSVHGLDGLVSDLRRTATEAPGLAANVVSHHAGQVVDRWRESVPDPAPTGKHLRDSIKHDFELDGRDPVGIAYSDWMVARFREYGTVKEPPKGEAAAALEAELPALAKSLGEIPRL